MRESLVKLLLVLTGLISIVIGGLLLIIPGRILAFAEITTLDVGMLRNMGAGALGLQGFGLMIVAFRRRDTNPLVGIVALVTTFQAGALWYSLFAGEFADTGSWVIILPGILTTIAAVVLWLSWISRRKSVGQLSPRKVGKRGAKAEIGEPESPPAELVEEIDSQSPRFRDQ